MSASASAPLVYLLLTSFWQVVNYQVSQRWTLENYYRIFAESIWLQVLLRTVIMATLVTLTSITLALPLAYFPVRYTSRWILSQIRQGINFPEIDEVAVVIVSISLPFVLVAQYLTRATTGIPAPKSERDRKEGR